VRETVISHARPVPPESVGAAGGKSLEFSIERLSPTIWRTVWSS
jgi:hypothetical protein